MPAGLKHFPTLILLTLVSACATVNESKPADSDPDIAISSEAKAFEMKCETDLAMVLTLLDKQEKITEPFTVETVLVPLNELQIALSNGARLASTYKSVHPDPDLRKVATDCLVKYSDIGTQLSLSRAT